MYTVYILPMQGLQRLQGLECFQTNIQKLNTSTYMIEQNGGFKGFHMLESGMTRSIF